MLESDLGINLRALLGLLWGVRGLQRASEGPHRVFIGLHREFRGNSEGIQREFRGNSEVFHKASDGFVGPLELPSHIGPCPRAGPIAAISSAVLS